FVCEWNKRIEVIGCLIDPIVVLVWLDIFEPNPLQRRARKKHQFFFGYLQLLPTRVANATALRLRVFDHEAYGDARLDTKDIVLGARQARVGAHISAKVNYVNVIKLICNHLAEAVKGTALDKTAIGHKCDDAVFVNTIRRPAKKPRIHVVELGLLRG